MTATRGDDDRGAVGLSFRRQEYRERRIVDVLVPPVLVLLAFVASGLETGRAVFPQRNHGERSGRPGARCFAECEQKHGNGDIPRFLVTIAHDLPSSKLVWDCYKKTRNVPISIKKAPQSGAC